MFLADYHTHTRLSPDSGAAAADMARAAVKAGLGGYCFTDHVDFLDLYGERGSFAGWRDYDRQFAQVRRELGEAISLRLGLELGEAWEDPALAAEITAHPELDFVIGSVHNLPSEEGGTDLYNFHYRDTDACHRVLGRYFAAMERLLDLPCWDALGHIIYPLRYMEGRDGNRVSLEPHMERLAGILGRVAAGGRAIEVNTCRGETVEEWRPILALYRDCGGTFVTLGSDAHRPQDVGKGIRAAAALAAEYGLDTATYTRRQPERIKRI